jgi:hypothetical protein
MRLKTRKKTTQVEILGLPIGNLVLWVPEGIFSDTGASSVYPVGTTWIKEGDNLIQKINEKLLFGPGNCYRINSKTLECGNVLFPLDSPVVWKTTLTAQTESLEFKIELTNVGNRTIKKASAAVCLRFQEPYSWSYDKVFVLSGNKMKSLAGFKRVISLDSSCQAYMLRGESFNNVFYHKYWGINTSKIDKAIMISEFSDANSCVGIMSNSAYFLHCNKRNPCTDIMLAFGDIISGMTAKATGHIWFMDGKANDMLEEYIRFFKVD